MAIHENGSGEGVDGRVFPFIQFEEVLNENEEYDVCKCNNENFQENLDSAPQRNYSQTPTAPVCIFDPSGSVT